MIYQLFIAVNPGMEKIARQEINELVNVNVKVQGSVLEFSLKNKEQIPCLIARLQSVRRIAVELGQYANIEEINFEALDFSWKDFFSPEISVKVTVENVKGNDNRIAISKAVMGKLFKVIESKLKFSPKIELRKPDMEILVYWSEGRYFVGLDLCGKELNSRAYRVFASQASFKGDLAYYFVRKSGFKAGEKLLVSFAKDGTIAIEAALYANCLIVNDNVDYSFHKFPLFKEKEIKERGNIEYNAIEYKNAKNATTSTVVYAFDENNQNVIAAKKNSILAKTKEKVDFRRYMLDELDVKFNENEFDCLIFQITTKDEDKLNEIYYQSSYLLKPKNKLLLIGRKGFEVSVGSKFKLVEEEEIQRGESFHKLWLLEKKGSCLS